MNIENTLPPYLAAYSEYALKLTEVDRPSVNVAFIITHAGNVKTFEIPYTSFNNEVTVHLGSILKSIFLKTSFLDLEFFQSEHFTANDNHNIAKLDIIIEDNALEFYVIDAAIQAGEHFEFKEGQILGDVQEMPRFNGYPTTTSILRNKEIEVFLNSRGCKFDISQIKSKVSIEVTKPNGEVVTMNNLLNLDIPDDAESNGIYNVKYTNEEGEILTRSFEVINAGDPIPEEYDLYLIFQRLGDDLPNSYAFRYESGYEEIYSEFYIFQLPNHTNMQWQITSPSGQRATFYGIKKVYWNPYVDDPTKYKPTEIGTYEVKAWTTINGALYEKIENFEVTAIQPAEDDNPSGSVDKIEIYLNNSNTLVNNAITLHKANNDFIRIRPIGSAEQFEMTVISPYGNVYTRMVDNGAELLCATSQLMSGAIRLVESGIYQFKASANGEEVTKNLRIEIIDIR